MHGWKGEGGMVRQPVFCRRKNRIIKILVMKFIPVIRFLGGITNAAQPGFDEVENLTGLEDLVGLKAAHVYRNLRFRFNKGWL